MQRLTGSDSDPISYLDLAVIRLATSIARKLVAEGTPIEEAASLACPGAWSELCSAVRRCLRESGDTLTTANPW